MARLPEGFDKEGVIADVQLVGWMGDLGGSESLPVHVGAVFAFEVEDDKAIFADEDTGMSSADIGASENNVAVRGASDGDIALVEFVALLAFGPVYGDCKERRDGAFGLFDDLERFGVFACRQVTCVTVMMKQFIHASDKLFVREQIGEFEFGELLHLFDDLVAKHALCLVCQRRKLRRAYCSLVAEKVNGLIFLQALGGVCYEERLLQMSKASK